MTDLDNATILAELHRDRAQLIVNRLYDARYGPSEAVRTVSLDTAKRLLAETPLKTEEIGTMLEGYNGNIVMQPT